MHSENHCDNKDRVLRNGNFTKHNTTYFRHSEWKTETPSWCFCEKISLAEIFSHLSLEIVFSFGTFHCELVYGGVQVLVVPPGTWWRRGRKTQISIHIGNCPYFSRERGEGEGLPLSTNLTTYCNSGFWRTENFSASRGNQTLVSHIPGKYHNHETTKASVCHDIQPHLGKVCPHNFD